MDGHSNCASPPGKSQEQVVLDVKPLQTLAPMPPIPFGPNSNPPSTQSPPVVCITPFGSFSISSNHGFPQNFAPFFPNMSSQQTSNKAPIHATPLNSRDGDAKSNANPGFPQNSTPFFPISSSHQTSNKTPIHATPLNSVNGELNADHGFPQNFNSIFPNSSSQQTSNKTPIHATPLNSINGAVEPDANRGFHQNFTPFSPNSSSQQTSNKAPIHATPLNSRNGAVESNANDSNSERKRKQQMSSSEFKKKPKPAKPKKVFDGNASLSHTCSSHDSRESVEVILMTFEALRRRVEQVDEGNNDGKRAYMKVGTIMTTNELRVNADKRIGAVPGVEIGDIFYFRFEMCLVGLHGQTMSGIDSLTAKFDNEEDTVAACIVSAGGYDNEDEDVYTIIYSGQGGSNKNGKSSNDDQKLERGNLALERSLYRGSEIRVVRSAKDFSNLTGRIYIYDGIYKIHESWVEKGKTGFNVFKFKLVREPGQRDGIAVWKMTQKWIENPSSRGTVILPDISSGCENIPVCLVNDVDDEKGPSHFTYITKVKYMSPINSTNPLHRCMCQSVCLPGDANCSCAQHNGGVLPYSSNGLLVSRKPLIYECNASCSCSVNCRNRVAQKGVKLNFEVFKTRDRGWGLRCWHPIRAGTFICEYTGEIIDKAKAGEDGEDNEYIFQGLIGDKSLKWNYIPELLGEPSDAMLRETPDPLSFVVSAKNMGNLARFINHSCSPNLFWQPVHHDHSDKKYPHIMFFAIKHIPPMTELIYDYGMSEGDTSRDSGEVVGSRRTKKCLCGSPKCRGFFG